jgi:hypothetical protein
MPELLRDLRIPEFLGVEIDNGKSHPVFYLAFA